MCIIVSPGPGTRLHRSRSMGGGQSSDDRRCFSFLCSNDVVSTFKPRRNLSSFAFLFLCWKRSVIWTHCTDSRVCIRWGKYVAFGPVFYTTWTWTWMIKSPRHWSPYANQQNRIATAACLIHPSGREESTELGTCWPARCGCGSTPACVHRGPVDHWPPIHPWASASESSDYLTGHGLQGYPSGSSRTASTVGCLSAGICSCAVLCSAR